MKNITHILHFHAFEFYILNRIMQTVQQERGMDMKQIFVSYPCPFPVELFALYDLECKIQKHENVKYE